MISTQCFSFACPILRYPHNVRHIFFKTLYGTTFPHTARLHKFMNNQTLPLRAGCRGRQPIHLDIFRYKVVKPTGERCSPLQILGIVYCAAKSLSLFADFTLCYGIEKAVQSFFYSDTALFYSLLCYSFRAFLHRLVGLRLLRLCLKLRQGFALYPQRVSPLDPDQGRAPGPFARFARCFFYFV